MVITKTPFRMSFFGGGTDIESYFKEYGGAVLSTSFDKYCYVTVRNLPPFFDYSTELSYSKLERVNSVDEIQHPAIRNAMKMLDLNRLRLTYEADLPARSGLGTSSSFAVGMLHAFHVLKGEAVNKKKLADEAIYLERFLCNEMGGWQDQIAASFGGFNKIIFSNSGYEISPINIPQLKKKKLNNRLLMFFTGFTRYSSEIQIINHQINNDSISRLKEIRSIVYDAEQILISKTDNLDDFGRLLDYTWKLKRQMGANISNSSIDIIYSKGISAGALGGKLLGAGGGGFIVFYVNPECHKKVKNALSDLLYIPFEFENDGTRIIYANDDSAC